MTLLFKVVLILEAIGQSACFRTLDDSCGKHYSDPHSSNTYYTVFYIPKEGDSHSKDLAKKYHIVICTNLGMAVLKAKGVRQSA